MQAIEDHPAKYSRPVLDKVQELLLVEEARIGRPLTVLDPFAGTGGIHTLAGRLGLHTWGIELEPEWAACHERTLVGNALALPFPAGSIDGWVSSVCYGNRMADSHQAADPCKKCDGRGWVLGEPTEGDSRQPCSTCKGYGLSRRNTYTHRLQAALRDPERQLHPASSATMRWGKRYRQFHEAAYREALRVIRPGGFALVNISNHLETSQGITVEHKVAEWTLNTWLLLGVTIAGCYPVPTMRNGQGANRDTRCEFEHVMAFRVPACNQPQLC